MWIEMTLLNKEKVEFKKWLQHILDIVIPLLKDTKCKTYQWINIALHGTS